MLSIGSHRRVFRLFATEARRVVTNALLFTHWGKVQEDEQACYGTPQRSAHC
jgi:hypothetical protein